MKSIAMSMFLVGTTQPAETFNLIPSADWIAPYGSALAQNPANLEHWWWDGRLKCWWRRGPKRPIDERFSAGRTGN